MASADDLPPVQGASGEERRIVETDSLQDARAGSSAQRFGAAREASRRQAQVRAA